MTFLSILKKIPDIDKNVVTTVTTVTAAPVLGLQGNGSGNDAFATVIYAPGEPEKVTIGNGSETVSLPKKSNDLALVTMVTGITVKNSDSVLFSGLESIPDGRPDDADFWEWSGAIDLKNITRQYGLKVRRSVQGSIVAVYPSPVNPQLVEYCADCLKDCRAYLASFPSIPIIPPAVALAEFRRMGGEVQHVQGGFVPVYPEAWPGYVKDAAQGLFLAAVDAIEEDARQEVEAAARHYARGSR